MAMSNLRDAVGLCIPYGKANSQYETEFEPATGTIWGYFKPRGTACFSLGLLKDIRGHDNALATNGGKVEVEGVTFAANHYVLASRTPRVFNLGGDLALFVLLIKARDRDALAHYAKLCIDNMYPRIRSFSCRNLTTISLVQGDALGGGFESARPCLDDVGSGAQWRRHVEAGRIGGDFGRQAGGFVGDLHVDGGNSSAGRVAD